MLLALEQKTLYLICFVLWIGHKAVKCTKKGTHQFHLPLCFWQWLLHAPQHLLNRFKRCYINWSHISKTSKTCLKCVCTVSFWRYTARAQYKNIVLTAGDMIRIIIINLVVSRFPVYTAAEDKHKDKSKSEQFKHSLKARFIRWS